MKTIALKDVAPGHEVVFEEDISKKSTRRYWKRFPRDKRRASNFQSRMPAGHIMVVDQDDELYSFPASAQVYA